MNYILLQFLAKPKLAYFFLFLQIYLAACSPEESRYDPCSQVYKMESISPSSRSRMWVPYTENEPLIFKNSSEDSIILKPAFINKILPGKLSEFLIQCPQDSSKNSIVNYSTRIYHTKLINGSPHSSLISIDLYLDVLIDEQKSTLDDFQMADILKIEFNIKTNLHPSLTVPVIQFPVFERGYKNALYSEYTFFSQKVLGNYSFSDVFQNLENSEQLNIYYSELGILAFEIESKLYVIKN